MNNSFDQSSVFVRRFFMGVGVAALFVLSTPVWAQSSRDVTNRLERLENELQTLNRAVYKGEAPPPSDLSSDSVGGAAVGNPADMQVRLQQLEVEITKLNGKLEEQDFQIRQLKEQLERSLSDFEMRLGGAPTSAGVDPQATSDTEPLIGGSLKTLEPAFDAPGLKSGDEQLEDPNAFNWSSGKASSPESSSSSSSAAGVLGGGSSESAAAAYENAFSLIKNSQYEEAQKAFDDFLKNNPDHALAGNAKYWLGETYYVKGDFAKSARIFAEGYKKYPNSTKAPDNLLKLGLSLSGLGKKDDACVALKQLSTQYPTGSQPVLRRGEQEMKTLNCA